MKYLVGITTYNPEICLFKKNLASIKKTCGEEAKICIVDNGSSNTDEIKNVLHHFNNIEVFFSDRNLGIAKALNIMMNNARKEAYDWVLTLDQDSIIPFNLLKSYEYTAKKFRQLKIGIICPVIVERNIEKAETYEDRHESVQIIDYCITSGSLTNVNAWVDVNGFDDKLFIDYVDLDFCAKLKLKNYKILRDTNVKLSHAIGKPCYHNLFGHHILSTSHNSIRHYYYSRNLLAFKRRYRNIFPNLHLTKAWISEFLCILLYENEKTNKMKAMIKGAIDSRGI